MTPALVQRTTVYWDPVQNLVPKLRRGIEQAKVYFSSKIFLLLYIMVIDQPCSKLAASGSTLDISISGVLEELSKTPLPTSNLMPRGTNEVLLNVADIAMASAIKPSEPLTHERTKSTEIPTEKLFKTLSDNSVGDDSLDSKDKKSSGVTMKNLISHFMSNIATGQVVQVCLNSLDCL
jgi:hypothetical protein